MAARLTAYLVVAIVSATLIAGLIVGAQRDDSDGPVDLILHNASVYTADRRGSMAEAVAVRGNQILRVGTDREVLRLQRPQTVMVDAKGGTVLPGFNDAHLQLMRGALALASVDLRDAASAAEIQSRIEAWSLEHPDSSWVPGHGWSSEHFRSSFPARQFLDAVAGSRPILLSGADETTSWANSAALRLAGITRDTADPPGGMILREARTGEPSGVLRGTATQMVEGRMPPPSREERLAALRSAVATANAAGITSVQSLDDTPEAVELYDELRRTGDLTVRVFSALGVEAPLHERDLAALADIQTRYADDPLLKAGALSLRIDGPVAARLAAMLEPYAGSVDQRSPVGHVAFTPDDLNRAVRLADAAGWQVILHASGDRAVRMALDALAHASRSNRAPERGRRHRIENIAFVDAADVSRFATLGVLASMQPARGNPSPHRMELMARTAGPARAARSFPFRTLSDETRLVFGSAWPAFDLRPAVGLHVAVNQVTPEGTPAGGWHASERLPLKRAIDAYTAAGAWASFDDQRKGALSPGMLADLTVLSENIFAEPADRIAAASVAYTVFDGRIVYSRTARLETAPALTHLVR